MKQLSCLTILVLVLTAKAQNVTTDFRSFTPQELVENILINSGCVENVRVTDAVSGNFGGGDLSYGYFNNNSGPFPFTEGLVLSSGRLSNVDGPNSTLSDDTANNWNGDADLENALGIGGTTNATIIEFDFTPRITNLSFNYIFASEEYRQNDANTCNFSDAFAFLIRPRGGNYENIAVIPGTTTPVQVTTVRPDIIVNGNLECAAINEQFFGSFNDVNAPINFNGQTAILNARTTVTPNTVYHIKLVLADEGNPRFDSAVFLEAGSFGAATDLGPDRLVNNGTALCPNESEVLQALQAPAGSTYTYQWFRDGVLESETTSEFNVATPGTYSVIVTLSAGCEAEDAVVIEYYPDNVVNDAALEACDTNGNGQAIFNLTNAEDQILQGTRRYRVLGYYNTESGALNTTMSDEITTPSNLTSGPSSVYAATLSPDGCIDAAEIVLTLASTTTLTSETLEECSTTGFATFSLTQASALYDMQTAAGSTYRYYRNTADAQAEVSEIVGPNYQNEVADMQILIVVVENPTACYEPITLNLVVTSSTTLNVVNSNLDECDLDNNGREIFNLFDAEADIIQNEPNTSVVNFFFLRMDAENNVSPISNPTVYDSPGSGEIVYARVENRNGCANVAEVTLNIQPANNVTAELLDACGNSGFTTFNLNEASALFDSQTMPNSTYTYYRNQADLNSGNNITDLNFQNDTAVIQTLIVVIENPNQCYTNTTLDLVVTETPQMAGDETITNCFTTANTLTLQSGVTNDNGTFTYMWSTGETSESIEVTTSGEYTVTVANNGSLGCLNFRTITVDSQFTSNVTVSVSGNLPDFTVTVNTAGSGDFLYAIDTPNGPFQDSNVFTNVSSGEHVAYVQNGSCGITSQAFTILDFPDFFTPNNDGFNDFWNVTNTTGSTNNVRIIYIFDRFGKLLKTLLPTGRGWDGTYNGQPMPSGDYWFLAEFQSGFEFKNHFTLKR